MSEKRNNESPVCRIKPEEYRYYVLVANKINDIAEDLQDKDQKRKFLMRNCPPSVEQLESHHVRERLPDFLPYLVYYHEPDLSYFLGDYPEVGSMRRYIRGLFRSHVEIVQSERANGPLRLTYDDYDRIAEAGSAELLPYLNGLTPYEKDVLCFKHELTLERFQSLDIAVNMERFLPFVIRMTDTAFAERHRSRQGPDWDEITRCARRILYDSLELYDEED